MSSRIYMYALILAFFTRTQFVAHMADVEESTEQQAEETTPVKGAESPLAEEKAPTTPPGEKEANKPPSPKPDQDEPDSAEVAPPLVSKEGENEAEKPAASTEPKGVENNFLYMYNTKIV